MSAGAFEQKGMSAAPRHDRAEGQEVRRINMFKVSYPMQESSKE